MRWTPGASRLLAAYLVGLTTAVWLVPVVSGPTVQRLRLERDDRQAKVEALEREVLSLKEQLQKQSGSPLVKKTVVKLEYPTGDRRVILEAQRRVQKELDDAYVGRAIDDISPILIYQVVDRLQDKLTIDGVGYKLEVRFLAVGPEMTLVGVLRKDGDKAEEKITP